jgi:hypothetical protein
MWTAPGEIVDRERHIVQSLKFMLTVMWNPIGFHVLKALPNGLKFNAQYCTILYKSYLGRNLKLEAADRGNTTEQVVGAF